MLPKKYSCVYYRKNEDGTYYVLVCFGVEPFRKSFCVKNAVDFESFRNVMENKNQAILEARSDDIHVRNCAALSLRNRTRLDFVEIDW